MIRRFRRYWNRLRGRRFWYVPYYAARRPEYFDFEQMAENVGPGWAPLLQKLTDKLFSLGWDGGLLQVKEKFGTLRFYHQNNVRDPLLAEVVEDVVEAAENRSGQTCERCGKYGEVRGDGWLVTRCQGCWEKEKHR